MTRVRPLALLALCITAAAVLYTAGAAITGWQPRLGWLFQAVIHVGELLTVLALTVSSAGRGSVARIGLAAALLGQITLIAGEVIWPRNAGLGDTLFAIGPLLTGVGLIVAGTAIVRSRRPAGWPRFTPLAVGAYVFVVLIPVLIGSGGPPAPAALWAIAGWDLLWALTAAAALSRTPSPALASPTPAA